jgi:hypothetical protein
MNKEKFKEIMITTLSSVPDNSIRAEVLKKELNNTGISFESALASANYFYNEMLKIYSGQESTVYRGKVIVTDEAFCFIDSLNVCYNHNSFKFYITSFENFGEVLALVSNTENTKSIKSFDSKLTDIQLQTLYKALINEYIHSKTTFEQFKAVFTTQPVETITKIDWLKEPVLLAYFIDNLFDKKYIRRHPKKWKILDIVFTKAENLKQITENYKNNQRGQPLNHSEIDKLIDLL